MQRYYFSYQQCMRQLSPCFDSGSAIPLDFSATHVILILIILILIMTGNKLYVSSPLSVLLILITLILIMTGVTAHPNVRQKVHKDDDGRRE